MVAWSILIPAAISCVSILLLYYILRRRKGYLKRVLQTSTRDLRGLCILIRIRLRCTLAFWRDKGIQEIFLETVKKYPTKEAIYDITLRKSFTFTELDELACRYAHMIQKHSQVQPDDVVAIFMENSVHFVAAWLACAKIGAISAWINTNLRAESLAHSLTSSKACAVLCSASLQKELIQTTRADVRLIRLLIFSRGSPHTSDIKPIDQLLLEQPSSQPTTQRRMSFRDPLCYIFTSGTTGMPKPAVIKHFRYFYMATGGECAFGINPKKDRIYVCLPMYHSSAGVMGIGQTVVYGATCVIREKFSASNFWKDCVQYRCTVSQYIGELLRYLLLTEKSPYEAIHCVRLLIGNGLRLPIWQQFQERFKIKRIAEFYGSTEGTSNLVNIDGKEGACGFMTILDCFAPIYPIRLFKVDKETGELIRDKRGYCIPIRPGESGMLACSIRKNSPLYHFEGYVDNTDTQKKIIQEPLPGSNPVFLSGDILYWDKLGYFYFRDRTGDTFRWKGENISTTQVEAVLYGLTDVHECTVYGVKIPEHEGRAGMAAITPNINTATEDLLTLLYERFTATLPASAVPCFIRIAKELDKTGTFKMKKADLQSLGLARHTTSPVYFLNHEKKTFSLLTDSILAEIESGQRKL
ncbi:Long-chain fatty acid transport protein 4 [Trichostrongylus colubriformis]|uniref:Long-chain-fatty-acid--CoA ligase n=1 Tax=Trichostrongylus colubriformis TaxID=6319 RepID=A0AAN8F7C5_TRICO